MGVVVLRFLLAGAIFVDIAIKDGEARKLIEAWHKDPSKVPPTLGGVDELGRSWAVKTDQIVALTTETYAAAKPAVGGVTSSGYDPFKRGNN